MNLVRQLRDLSGIVLGLLLAAGCATDAVRFKPRSGDMADAMQPENSAVSERKSRRMIVVTMTDQAHRELSGGQPIGMIPPDDSIDSLRRYNTYLRQLKLRHGIRRVADWPLKSLGVRCFVFELDVGYDRDTVIAQLKNDPLVETVQSMQMFSVLADGYNDPYLKVQNNLAIMAVPASHRWATGKGVTVGVVDTGVDVKHEDLHEQITMRKNFVNNDDGGFAADLHGTAVAGIIAADTNNGTGMVGIAPDARIMALKACWQTSAGDIKAACSSFTLAKAIDFAILNDIDILNLSLAGPSDPLLQRLVEKALEQEVGVVAAISLNPDHSFAANIEGVIAVHETAAAPGTNIYRSGVTAPGVNILSTRPGDRYDFFSGSSFSTAQVAGLVALIKERKPHLASDKIKALLLGTREKLRSAQDGDRPVHACRALAPLVGGECPQ
jgi:subtilisin family serine protease